MWLNKLKKFLISSLSLLTLLCRVEQAQSAQEMDVEPGRQQGHKTLRTQILETEVHDLVRSYPTIGELVSGYLQLYDLCTMELVCNRFAGSIRNAIQYQAILFDPEGRNAWKHEATSPYKDSFLSLMKTNDNFRVHFYDLWRNHFPLKMIIGLPLNMPLYYYWERYLTPVRLDSMCEAYQEFLFGPGATTHPQSSFFFQSLIGRMQTTRNANRDFATDRKICTNIINETNADCLPSIKAETRYCLAEMNQRGQGAPTDFTIMRASSKAIRDDKWSSPGLKVRVELGSTIRSVFHGHDVSSITGSWAREVLQRISNSNEAYPEDRAEAQFYKAEMDRRGLGVPTNFDVARRVYNEVFNNDNASPEHRIGVQNRLADMDFIGQGGPVDYTKARVGYQAVINNGFASDYEKFKAHCGTVQIDYWQHGDVTTYPSYRNAFLVLKGTRFHLFHDNPHTPRIEFCLAEMDFRGQGGSIDYDKAEQGFQMALLSFSKELMWSGTASQLQDTIKSRLDQIKALKGKSDFINQ
jgi:TPR repeat protein